jgi:5-oxoprolinase (ATP-hydrolysing)
MKALDINIPEGSMLNPKYPAAVVAGNVETSQLVVDTLYGALGIMAAAQGTMNNVTFGSSSLQYYETVGGGSGAGDGFNGADAVHSHMTNSRLTDPEVLEHRYPVLLERFAIRRGSGGSGKYRGGNGIDRRIRFKEPMTVSILSNRRIVPPYGMANGGSGAVGKCWIAREVDDSMDMMKSCDKRDVNAEDVFVLQTPGGGGYGNDGHR